LGLEEDESEEHAA